MLRDAWRFAAASGEHAGIAAPSAAAALAAPPTAAASPAKAADTQANARADEARARREDAKARQEQVKAHQPLVCDIAITPVLEMRHYIEILLKDLNAATTPDASGRCEFCGGAMLG